MFTSTFQYFPFSYNFISQSKGEKCHIRFLCILLGIVLFAFFSYYSTFNFVWCVSEQMSMCKVAAKHFFPTGYIWWPIRLLFPLISIPWQWIRVISRVNKDFAFIHYLLFLFSLLLTFGNWQRKGLVEGLEVGWAISHKEITDRITTYRKIYAKFDRKFFYDILIFQTCDLYGKK